MIMSKGSWVTIKSTGRKAMVNAMAYGGVVIVECLTTGKKFTLTNNDLEIYK